MGYVIMRGGKYVTPRGSFKSYTSSLQNARIYDTKEQAENDKCENELVIEK